MTTQNRGRYRQPRTQPRAKIVRQVPAVVAMRVGAGADHFVKPQKAHMIFALVGGVADDDGFTGIHLRLVRR